MSISDKWMATTNAEKHFEWFKWIERIPFIKFPEYMEVKIIPPFSGAIVRFEVRHKDFKTAWVSVYLDCYNMLGFYGEPYWEVYPYNGDVYRCKMENVDELVKAIEYSLNQQIQGGE